jgi:hypothetical protein
MRTSKTLRPFLAIALLFLLSGCPVREGYGPQSGYRNDVDSYRSRDDGYRSRRSRDDDHGYGERDHDDWDHDD